MKNTSPPKPLSFMFAKKRYKYFVIFLSILLCIYIFAPYLLVYLGLKVLTSEKRRGGFINFPVEDVILGGPLMRLGHNMSSRGTFYFLRHGNLRDKEIVLDAFEHWPHKSDALTLISYAKAEKNSKIRDGIIYVIGSCQNDKALPFLEKLLEQGEIIGLIAMCKMQTNLAENKLFKIYQNTNNNEIKSIILSKGYRSLNFTKNVIMEEDNLKMRLNAFWGYLAAKNNQFHKKNKGILLPFDNACSEWCYERTFSPSDLIDSFEKHPELSLDDKKFLLLGHAVLRNPKSIPFLKKINTQSKSESLRKLAEEILKVIPETPAESYTNK